MTSITYRGIEVQVIDQAEEAVTVRALYGEPFTTGNGENTSTTTISPFELSEAISAADTFSVCVYA